jgi:glucan phosphoethanolaminetransferase (alkaline phosphatase superfamily)
MPCIGTTLTLSRSLSRLLCLHFLPIHILYFFRFCFFSYYFKSSTSLSSIPCAFIFLFNHILSGYFFPLFFLAFFIVLCSFVFMSCIFPYVFGHSPVLQHWDLTHFRYIDIHFMPSHRFMSEGFGIHLMSLKLQEVQYEYISCASKIEGKTFAAYSIFVVVYLTVVRQFTEQQTL